MPMKKHQLFDKKKLGLAFNSQFEPSTLSWSFEFNQTKIENKFKEQKIIDHTVCVITSICVIISKYYKP